MALKARGKSVTRKPGRLSADDTFRLDADLLDAAERLFLEQGYARTTMDALAKSASVTRKTLYARYSNKEEIFAAVIDRMLDKPNDFPSVAPEMRGGVPKTILTKLARHLVTVTEAPRTAKLSRLIYAEAAETPELVLLASNMYVRLVASVVPTLEALQAGGHLRQMPPVHAAAALFIEMIVSTARSRAVMGEPLPRKQLGEQIDIAVVVFLRGCGEVI